MTDFEKLGLFYLGREVDPATKSRGETPLLYDSSDLVTHGVIVGMTGSGKTGLGIDLIEEAAIDGVPVIAIDPKGDLGNLLLTFPGLSASEFTPWVNPDEARRAGPLVRFSSDMHAQSAQLKKFLFASLYRHPQVTGRMGKAKQAVRELFDAYLAQPTEMRPEFARREDRHRAVADYIAGMTDRFALREHERLTGTRLL